MRETPRPEAAVVVRRDREVLLVRRAAGPFAGRWGLPARYQELDEAIETTAVREVREATGLVVRLRGILDVVMDTDDPREPATQIVYTGEETDGELVPGPDCAEVGFFTLGDLPEGATRASHLRLLERLKTGLERTW